MRQNKAYLSQIIIDTIVSQLQEGKEHSVHYKETHPLE